MHRSVCEQSFLGITNATRLIYNDVILFVLVLVLIVPHNNRLVIVHENQALALKQLILIVKIKFLFHR